MVSIASIISMCLVQCFLAAQLFLRLAFGSSFYPHPSPLYFPTDISVWQVPGSIGEWAHGWKAPVYQPWGHKLCLGAGFAERKVEVAHPRHPPPLSNAVVNLLYLPTNSPNWPLYISIKNKLREFGRRSKHFLLGHYFINSHNLFCWLCVGIVRRKGIVRDLKG